MNLDDRLAFIIGKLTIESEALKVELEAERQKQKPQQSDKPPSGFENNASS